jgi:hypothetical protein
MNPSVDVVGGVAEEKDQLGRGQGPVLAAPQLPAAASGVVDQVAASLAGEFQQRIRIHHGADATGQ